MTGISRRNVLATLAVGAAGIGAFGRERQAFAAEAAVGDAAPALTGTVVFPDSPDYDEARQLWDRLFVSYPYGIVFCENADDVVNAVAWSRRNGIKLRARGGRHALEGWSSIDGGVVIDVGRLKQISIDVAAGTATVGTGLTQGELVAGLADSGHTVPTGSEASVGIAGVTLGGGIGPLSRSLGLTCDNLLAVDIVIPDGRHGARLVHADAENHADLLWACRGGGGGNFGIAIAYTFRIQPIGPIAHFKVTWDWKDPAAAFNAWQEWAPRVDRKLGSTFVFLPKASNVIEAEGIFQGSADTLKVLLQPLLVVGSPTVKIETNSWPQHFKDSNAGPRQFLNWRFSSSWVYQPLPSGALEAIDHFMTTAPAPACNYWCLNWGGATRDEPPGGSAFFHRDPLYFAEPGAGWNDPAETGPVAVWIAQFRQAMRPFVSGAYVNVPDAAFDNWGVAYYGSKNFARLRQIKRIYDPSNVFSFPQSIPVG